MGKKEKMEEVEGGERWGKGKGESCFLCRDGGKSTHISEKAREW